MSWGAGATAVTFATASDREQFQARWETCLHRTFAALSQPADRPLWGTILAVAKAQDFGLAGPPLRQFLAENLALNATMAAPIPTVHFGFAMMIGHGLFVHDMDGEHWAKYCRALLNTNQDDQVRISNYGTHLRAALGGENTGNMPETEVAAFAEAALAGASAERSSRLSSATNGAALSSNVARHHHRLFGGEYPVPKAAFMEQLLADAVRVHAQRGSSHLL